MLPTWLRPLLLMTLGAALAVEEALRPDPRPLIVGLAAALLGLGPADWIDVWRGGHRKGRDDDSTG